MEGWRKALWHFRRVGFGQQEMYQMGNSRREQDSNWTVNLFLRHPLIRVLQYFSEWELWRSFLFSLCINTSQSTRQARTSTKLTPLTEQIQVIHFCHFLALVYCHLSYFILSHLLLPSLNNLLHAPKGNLHKQMTFFLFKTKHSFSSQFFLSHMADNIRVKNESQQSTSLLVTPTS